MTLCISPCLRGIEVEIFIEATNVERWGVLGPRNGELFGGGVLPLLTYGCFQKNRGKKPKMDGENNGKPYEQMDDLGVPLFWMYDIYIYILYIYIPGTCECPLFWWLNPPKQGLFESKQGSLRYTYIYADVFCRITMVLFVEFEFLYLMPKRKMLGETSREVSVII